jgi:valyl-tRNA synthetase
MTDLTDTTQEITPIEASKLQEEVDHIEDEIHRITNKLQNEGFISRVPAAMIEKEQKKLAALKHEQKKAKERLLAHH